MCGRTACTDRGGGGRKPGQSGQHGRAAQAPLADPTNSFGVIWSVSAHRRPVPLRTRTSRADADARRAADSCRLSSKLEVDLQPRRLHFPSGAYCDVDGVSADERVLVEAFARQSKLKCGQRGKIARDALKLLTLREHRPAARLIIALADPAVVKSLTTTSWLAEALRTFNVEVLHVDIPTDARDRIAATEIRQVMANPSALAPGGD